MQASASFQGNEIRQQTGDVLNQITNISAPAFNYKKSEICTSRTYTLYAIWHIAYVKWVACHHGMA